MPKKGRSILILMHSWVGFIHGVQKGIAQYFNQHPEWMATRQSPFPAQIARLTVDSYDGIITYADQPYIEALQHLRIPVVNISNGSPGIGLPAVFPDDPMVGRLAAEYLKDLGLPYFAWYGRDDYMYSHQRREAFIHALARHEITVHQYPINPDAPAVSELPTGIDPNLLGWLQRLPKPIGIFATTDAWASDLLQVCRFAGIAVPQEICVLGVDNDELLAALSYPPLSSIELPTEAIGFESARLLERLMAGEAAPAQPILLPPVRVVSRQSTNLLAIADTDVATAIRHIRDSVQTGVTVTDLLRLVPMNRRYFERKFKKLLGRTPLQEILRVRVEHAKELLATTDLAISVIAKRSGFSSSEQLATVFRRMTGGTPTLYRRGHRLRE